MRETLAPPTPAPSPALHSEQLQLTQLTPIRPDVPESQPIIPPSTELVAHEQVLKERTPATVVRFNGDPEGDTVSVFDMEHHEGQKVAYRNDPRTSSLKNFNHEALITLADGSTLFRKNDSIYSINPDDPSATKKLVELDLEKETPGFVMGQSWDVLQGITDAPVVGMLVRNKHPKHQAKHRPDLVQGWVGNSAGEISLAAAPLSADGESPFARANSAVAGYKPEPAERTRPRFGFRRKRNTQSEAASEHETGETSALGVSIEGAWSYGTNRESTRPAVIADDEKGVFGVVSKSEQSNKVDTYDASAFLNTMVHRILTEPESPPASLDEAKQRMADAIAETQKTHFIKEGVVVGNYLNIVTIEETTYGIWGRSQAADEGGILLQNEDGEFEEITSKNPETQDGPAVGAVVLEDGDRIAMVTGTMLHEDAMSDEEILHAFAGGSHESAEKFIKQSHSKDPNKGALVLHMSGIKHEEAAPTATDRRSKLSNGAAALMLKSAAELGIQSKPVAAPRNEVAPHSASPYQGISQQLYDEMQKQENNKSS